MTASSDMSFWPYDGNSLYMDYYSFIYIFMSES